MVTVILAHRRNLHIGGVAFSNNSLFAEPVSRFEQWSQFHNLSLDIETEINTFDI